METYWKQKDGTLISVDDMDINHLRNTLKMIIKNLNKIEEKKVKPTPKFKLHGDIAQDHFDMMMQQEFEDDMGSQFYGL